MNYTDAFFGRTKECDEAYKERKKNHNILEYIINNVVDNFRQPVVLVENDFPYNLEEGAKHMVLWSNKAMVRGEIEAFLDSSLKGKRYIWFRNTEANMSVPNIHHYQVLTY